MADFLIKINKFSELSGNSLVSHFSRFCDSLNNQNNNNNQSNIIAGVSPCA